MLDRFGKPIEEPAVAISSFAWGIPKALAGDLAALGEWQGAEQPLLEQLDHLLRREGADGEARARSSRSSDDRLSRGPVVIGSSATSNA